MKLKTSNYFWIGTILGLLVALQGCHSGKFQTGPKQPQSVDVKRAYKHHAVEVEKQKTIKEARYIYIEGIDLELPLTGGKDEPQDKRIYTYYVWAYHPVLSSQKPLADILTNELQIDVLGAKASIRPAQYSGPDQPAGFSNLTSRTVIEVNINSEDIHQAFEILAWFPKDSAEFQATNHSALDALNSELDRLRRQGKRVDANELKTLIERAETVMKTENPWQAKKQVRVYNGDMRSKIYMESQDTVSHVFGPQFSKYFFVGRIYMRNKRSDKQLVVYTTSLRAHTLFYRPPDDDLKSSKAISKAPLSERRDMLQSRIGMQLASENLQHQSEATAPTDRALTLEEATQVAQMASTNAVNSNPKGLLEVTTNDSPISEGAKLKEAQNIVNRVNSFRQQRFAEMTNEVPKYIPNWNSLDTNQKEQKQSEVTKALESRILKGEQEASTKETAEQIAVPLSEFQDEMESELNKIRRQYSGFGSVMDFNVPISVMIDRQPAAFSVDARQQALYNEHGFVWHDYYRPMTFQSVLSSLIVATEAGPRAQIVRYLETAGIIAGGLVGLSPVISEFGSKGYATAVAVSTAVFLPEARKLLLDDLNKYIKNLGDMGMDTVVVIPPNGVVDKYVFFPRGPIFYGIDEFSVNKPSYIVEVDNSDVAVEAILIEQGKVIETGVTSADKLVGEALNQGRSTRDAEELKLVKMTENLRTFRLTTLPAEVQKLIEHGNKIGAAKLVASVRTTFGPDQSGLLDRLVAEYNLDYGNTNRAPELTVSNIVTALAIGTNQGAISVTLRDPDNNPLRLDFLTDPNVVTGLRISGDQANPIQTSFTGLSNRSDLRFDIIVRSNSAAFTLLTNRLSNGKATTEWVDRLAVTNTAAP